MKKFYTLIKNAFFGLSLYAFMEITYALDQTGIRGVDDMLTSGQNIAKVAAKWGGIATVIGAALALGSGRLEGALAQTICKILIVVGLLIAAFGYFGKELDTVTSGFQF